MASHVPKVEAKVRHTTYVIEDNGNGFAKLTRTNDGGVQVTFYPLALVTSFAAPMLADKMIDLIGQRLVQSAMQQIKDTEQFVQVAVQQIQLKESGQ